MVMESCFLFLFPCLILTTQTVPLVRPVHPAASVLGTVARSAERWYPPRRFASCSPPFWCWGSSILRAIFIYWSECGLASLHLCGCAPYQCESISDKVHIVISVLFAALVATGDLELGNENVFLLWVVPVLLMEHTRDPNETTNWNVFVYDSLTSLFLAHSHGWL